VLTNSGCVKHADGNYCPISVCYYATSDVISTSKSDSPFLVTTARLLRCLENPTAFFHYQMY